MAELTRTFTRSPPFGVNNAPNNNNNRIPPFNPPFNGGGLLPLPNRNSVQSRLGHKSRDTNKRPNPGNYNNSNRSNNQFGPKRPKPYDNNQGSSGFNQPKRRWTNGYKQNMARERMHTMRNSNFSDTSSVADSSNFNQDDGDVQDITVQIVNDRNAAINNADDEVITRFKLELNPQFQQAIKKIQSKKTEKQVIFPYKIKPATTSVSMNARFTSL